MEPDFYIVYGRNRLGDNVVLYITTSQEEAYEKKNKYLGQTARADYFYKFIVSPFYNQIYL